jgi:periplasmic protein TonB
MYNGTHMGVFGFVVFAVGCSVGILVVTRHNSAPQTAIVATERVLSPTSAAVRAATEGEIVAAVEEIAPAPRTRTGAARSKQAPSAPVTRPAAAPSTAKPEMVYPLPLAQPVAPVQIELPTDEVDTPSAPVAAPAPAALETPEVSSGGQTPLVAPAASAQARGSLEPPQRIRKVAAQYPKVAQMANVEGTVIISAVIDVDGRVTSPRVVHSIPLLDQAALDAVRQWEFQPATRDGRPVPVSVKLSVAFALR